MELVKLIEKEDSEKDVQALLFNFFQALLKEQAEKNERDVS
jgi:hypothetical protein